MNPLKNFENYPVWIILLTNLHSLSIYTLGFLIIFNVGLWFALAYLLYGLTLEFRIIRYHCVNCYYWGKTCGFGKGRLSALLFKKGYSSQFCTKEFTWKDMIPDMLVLLIPLIIGIILLIIDFQILLLLAIAFLVFLATIGNGYIRGSLTCKYCKQKELGCPADALFNSKSP